ncbi:DUF397 domain-containing protein [Streptomyces sp. NPDC057654]|uniref:DUF397 domain-containing protein n=1 Tax=Streptomyces sp. NPDC057654 TaxID=3346196 RepID=UPI00369E7B54
MSTQKAARGPADLVWRKSSYSGSNGGQCVEVAKGSDTVHVRDSKDPDGGHLVVTPQVWSAFITTI